MNNLYSFIVGVGVLLKVIGIVFIKLIKTLLFCALCLLYCVFAIPLVIWDLGEQYGFNRKTFVNDGEDFRSTLISIGITVQGLGLAWWLFW